MTAADYRRLALALPEAVELSHMGHPDFRVGGRIFATLDNGETRSAVKLTPEQQEVLVAAEPAMFAPVNGAWGRRGMTWLTLAAADETTTLSALWMAWRNTAPKALAVRFEGAQP